MSSSIGRAPASKAGSCGFESYLTCIFEMTVKIKIADLPPEPQVTIELNARKTLDGDIMIFDHEDMDIVVMPSKKKVITIPKDLI